MYGQVVEEDKSAKRNVTRDDIVLTTNACVTQTQNKIKSVKFINITKRTSKAHERSRIEKQELGYCKQIARQLRIQYVKGIYANTVTLKSSLGSLKVIGNGPIR